MRAHMSNKIGTLLGVLSLAVTLLSAVEASAQDPSTKQMKLEAKQIEAMIAATKALNAIEPTDAGSEGEGEEAAETAEQAAAVDAIITKNGFADRAQFEAVSNSIMLALGAAQGDIESQMKAEIERVKADKELSDEQRTEILQQLEEGLRNVPKIEFPENAETVKPYAKEIDALFNGTDE